GVLLNITGGPDLGLFEVNEAAEVVTGASDLNANVIFGAVIDEGTGGRVRVTVIATGFDKAYRREPREREEPLAEREPTGEGFDVPSGVLEVPSFLRRS
ncbi:MAG: cell division protein FtsZ, partial [Gaiellaceae bacterium]